MLLLQFGAALLGARLENPDGSEQRGGRRNLPTPWSCVVELLRLDRLAPEHPRFRRMNLNEAEPLAGAAPVECISGAFMLMPRETFDELDGMDEDFSTFRNQTVLIDFWATWCGPCVKSLPDLRELNEELPADRFEILSISVDEEVDTVTEFQSDEPMPWANWHIGPRHDILKTWAVRGYPTYVLVDASGNIAARQHELNEELISLIRSTAQKRI